jgi:hypothetical protein
MQEFQEAISVAISTVILAAIPVLTAMAVNFIRSKTQCERMRYCLDELGNAVTAAVAYTGQLLVDDLKKGNIFTAEEQRSVKTMARDAVFDMLTKDTRKYLEEKHGDLPCLIDVKIEEVVRSAEPHGAWV